MQLLQSIIQGIQDGSLWSNTGLLVQGGIALILVLLGLFLVLRLYGKVTRALDLYAMNAHKRMLQADAPLMPFARLDAQSTGPIAPIQPTIGSTTPGLPLSAQRGASSGSAVPTHMQSPINPPINPPMNPSMNQPMNPSMNQQPSSQGGDASLFGGMSSLPYSAPMQSGTLSGGGAQGGQSGQGGQLGQGQMGQGQMGQGQMGQGQMGQGGQSTQGNSQRS